MQNKARKSRQHNSTGAWCWLQDYANLFTDADTKSYHEKGRRILLDSGVPLWSSQRFASISCPGERHSKIRNVHSKFQAAFFVLKATSSFFTFSYIIATGPYPEQDFPPTTEHCRTKRPITKLWYEELKIETHDYKISTSCRKPRLKHG